MNAPVIEALGGDALLIRLGAGIDDATNRAALGLAAALRAAGLPGIRDVAPAYASVCVRYDVAVWSAGIRPFGLMFRYAGVCASLRKSVGTSS